MEFFKLAKPIWQKGAEKEINLRLQFKATIGKLENGLIKIATSGMYQLWINGEFICYGPARAGKNHFRMDEIDISKSVCKNKNAIVIEVCGYNTNSFAIQNQTSFLQAEIVDDKAVIAYTGKDFTARKNPFYYQKINRYSYQRPMSESYNYSVCEDLFLTDNSVGNLELDVTEDKTIISRYAPYPQYEKITAIASGSGSFEVVENKNPWRERHMVDSGDQIVMFRLDELEVIATDECGSMVLSKATQNTQNNLKAKEYAVYKLPHESSGFFTAEIVCKCDTKVYITFDEILTDDGNVDFLRMYCANAMRLDLCKGKHKIQFFEVYTMQYIQLAVASGECEIEKIGMTEYKHPPIKIPQLKNKKLQKIAEAAAETYRQNAPDIFMDCPSRERAGWLCDSFFTARAEKFATGESYIEKSFLENYLHEETYRGLPDGMLPMCYPADHYNGQFIPQWAMWLVLELGEYYKRSGDRELINRFENKVNKLFEYFEKFENSDGLIEDLENWKFVEWSKANELTEDLNYPTNMIYSAALKTAGELYSNKKYTEKAEKIKRIVLEQSFNGTFFVDKAVRKEGKLCLVNEITEVCQYYAFFFGIATEQSHKKLYDTLMNDFGPQRSKTGKWREIYPAAPFIGYFLRLDILFQNGRFEELAKNIEGYYYGMAEMTGTLWEMAEVTASCCHGFSGYILCWLDTLSKLGY